MRVKLAQHWRDKVPGDVVNVDENTALGLRADGYVDDGDAAGISSAPQPRGGRRAKKTAAKKTAAPPADQATDDVTPDADGAAAAS